MTVQIIRQSWHPKLQVDVADYVGLSTDDKPTILTPGSTFHESDTGDDYNSGALGWTAKPAAAATPVSLGGEIPAGTKNIGDVDVLTLPALVAGEARIGSVGGDTYPIIVTPVIGAAAFTAGDFVGGKLTLANAGRVAGGSGIVNSLTIVDGAKQGITKGALRIYLFNADLAGNYADNAAESFTLADLLKLCPAGIIDVLISDWGATLANASVTNSAPLRNLNIPYKCAAGTSIYAIMRTLSDPTYTANCLQLTFGLLRD
jgi:hypothetical protein